MLVPDALTDILQEKIDAIHAAQVEQLDGQVTTLFIDKCVVIAITIIIFIILIIIYYYYYYHFITIIIIILNITPIIIIVS